MGMSLHILLWFDEESDAFWLTRYLNCYIMSFIFLSRCFLSPWFWLILKWLHLLTFPYVWCMISFCICSLKFCERLVVQIYSLWAVNTHWITLCLLVFFFFWFVFLNLVYQFVSLDSIIESINFSDYYVYVMTSSQHFG